MYTLTYESDNIPSCFTGKVVCETGTVIHYKNGKLHRDGDFPAVEWPSGHEEYWFEGNRHRIGGPAVITIIGKEYWLDGYKYSESDYYKELDKRNSCDGKLVEIDGKKYKLTLVKE